MGERQRVRPGSGAYKRSLEILDQRDGWQGWARCYFMMRDWGQADEAFRRIQELDRWDEQSHRFLVSSTQHKTKSGERRRVSGGSQAAPDVFGKLSCLASIWSSQLETSQAIGNLQELPGYKLGFGMRDGDGIPRVSRRPPRCSG